jgi:hypothetical protein
MQPSALPPPSSAPQSLICGLTPQQFAEHEKACLQTGCRIDRVTCSLSTRQQ